MSKISAITSFRQDMVSAYSAQKSENADIPYYFDPKRAHKDELKESRLLPNNLKTKWEITKHKCLNAISVYPAKGFIGDKNSNFYEYLTMGMFPYLTGGLTFIALFNAASKYFNPKDAKAASKYGFGMALGVIFYGLAKSLSQKLISIPVALKTGIDMDIPCRKVVDLIPRSPEQAKINKKRQNQIAEAGKEDNTAFEYHKAFESVDFPRMDLFYKKGRNRNEYFDKIAEKNGFGTHLNDSDQEVKPFIKEVVVKAKTAQNLSQYLWAATGVGLGVQSPWSSIIDITPRKYSGESLGKHMVTVFKTIKEAFFDSCKSFLNGGTKGVINKNARYAGRALLGLAIFTTVLGAINAVRNPYMKNNNMSGSKIFNDASKVVED